MAFRLSISQLLDRVGPTTLGNATTRRDEPTSSSERLSGVPPAVHTRFKIRSELGRGGMGIVFQAYDSELGHEVALKSLSRLGPDDLYYLKQEFRSLADIKHPHLVDLYELFADERSCFFTMELINGRTLLSHLRALSNSAGRSGDFDVLRQIARQLAVGIAAVHAAGKLHRDIKPSNVMVTSSGRVVLLDFGLAAQLSREATTDGAGTLVGTVEYMSPEQAQGRALSPAADWYSFGATLFEAIAGRPPLDHPLKWLLGNTTEEGPSRLGRYARGVPSDLEDLVASLLHPLAEHRPSGNDVLNRIVGTGVSIPPISRAHSAPAVRPLFEGRQREMEHLVKALTAVESGKTMVVHLHGASGIGKTELARCFVERAESSGAWILRGRCHPQESVAFNALDGMVDDLSRLLEGMPQTLVTTFLPRHAHALPRIFPVLARVSAIESAPSDRADESGSEAFRRGTRALKELLSRLAGHRPLILWLDDVQWGDEDSGHLLRELLRPPEAPAVLLLLTYRTEDRLGSKTLNALDMADAPDAAVVTTVDLRLGPLTEPETLALVQNLLGDRWGGDGALLGKLAREADGFPFFAHELARYLGTMPLRDIPESSRLRLDDMLNQRMMGLTHEARTVLEVVAVAGGPLQQRLLLRAAGVGQAARTVLAALETSSLVRSATLDAERQIEIYHHRVRDAVIDQLSVDTRRGHHRAIADAMLTLATPNLPRIVEHFEASGDVDGVRRYVVSAARQSAGVLAFDRAAGLYRRAIELGGTELDDVELGARLGEMLSNAGRGREAGAAFEAAAEHAERGGALKDRVLFLGRRAAEQYLKSGHRDDATRLLAAVLAPLGLEMPKTRRAAVRQTMINRAAILIRGLDFEPYREGSASAGALHRIDMLKVLMATAGLVDHTVGAALGSRLLLEALKVGEPDHVAFGLASECATWAPLPGKLAQGHVDRMFEVYDRICRQTQAQLHRSGYHQCRGVVAWFRGDFRASEEHLRRAVASFKQMRQGTTFNVASCEAFRLPALAQLGRLRELSADLESELRDADDRGDGFFISTCAAGQPSIAWLAEDRPEVALSWAERVLSSAGPEYSTQRYLHLISVVQTDLYNGDGVSAHRRMHEAWPRLKENFFLSLAYVRDELRHLRARAAITAAHTLHEQRRLKISGFTHRDLLKLAEGEARVIERNGLTFGLGLAALLRAGIACERNQSRAAATFLRRARVQLDLAGMTLYAHAAAYCLSRDGDTMARAEGDRWMRSEGVVDPARIVRTLAPGCLP